METMSDETILTIDEIAAEIEDIDSYLLDSYSTDHWKRIGIKKRAGVVVPVFSLRSENDEGAGTFADLKLLADWCCQVGHSVIQILPINDTAGNVSPYSAVSAFALDPMLLAIRQVPLVRNNEKLLALVDEKLASLAGQDRVGWVALRETKEHVLQEVYNAFLQEADPADSERCEIFIKENQYWLPVYAYFRSLKERFDQKSWVDWPDEYRFGGGHIDTAMEQRANFFSFVQWLLEEQLMEVKRYCEEKGVLLKGDIPILLARDSADVWCHRHYFNMDVTAGAPPDMFSDDGQNWGFPTYKWQVLAEAGYDWWGERLKQAEKFLHMYRIDHVVGFFRIWTIPEGEETGRNGYFIPEDEDVWEVHGRVLLQMMLDSTAMLPLAEDLGVVPPCCRKVLLELGIPGTKVDRWERNWEAEDGPYLDVTTYNPVSVATLSTHDTDTVRGWWQDFPDDRKPFLEALGLPGTPPKKLNQKTHRLVLKRAYEASSLFTLNLLPDLLSWKSGVLDKDPAENRINVPGPDNPNNWTFRFPFTLEDLMTAKKYKQLNTFLTALAKDSGRSEE